MRTTTWVAALASLGLCAGVHAAETFGPRPVQPAAHQFTLGKLKLTSLHDAQYVFPNDGKIFGVGGVDTATMSALLRAAGAPTDRITLSVNALLVRTDHRLLLIDTGLGPKFHGALPESLQQVNIKPAAITDVLITHSHGDHTGGLVDASGHLAFPKATIRMSSAEWSYMQTQAPQDVIKAISSRVHTFEPGARIAPGVTSVALVGHTPGHVGYEITSGEAHLLDIGDLAHSSIVSLEKPEWTIQFDKDDASAKAIRVKTLKQLAGDHELVFSPHFPFPGVGQIEAAGEGFVWKPTH